MDDQVAVPTDKELARLLDQFVCVRLVQDPKRVGREVAGKQPQHMPEWRRPELIPALARNKMVAKKFTAHAENRNLRNHGVGCIHCHMVQRSELISLRLESKPIDDRLVWPYPMPSAVGLQMDPQKRSTVKRVYGNSAAARAGVQAGDEILVFDRQRILSTADMQWVLHHAPPEGKIGLAVRRDGKTRELALTLAEDWRRRLGDWRFVNTGVCMQIAGFNGRPTRDGGKRLAIRVGLVHRKRMADVDLKKNDIIVAIDGSRAPMNLGKLTRYLLDKKIGSEIEVTRRRRGEDSPKTVRWILN